MKIMGGMLTLLVSFFVCLRRKRVRERVEERKKE